MGRKRVGPRKVHGSDGLYFAVYRDKAGKTYRESLGTRDHEKAMLLWPAAYQRLKDRAAGIERLSPFAEARQQWAYLKALYEADGDPVWAAAALTGKAQEDPETGQLLDPVTDQIAQSLVGKAQLPMSWEEALEFHARRKLERTGKPLAESTKRSIRTAFSPLQKAPEALSVADVRDYIEGLREAGYKATSIAQRCSLLQGVTQSLIKGGWLSHDKPNPWALVDTAAAKNNHIPTATPEQCRLLFGSNELAPEARLAVRLMIYLGCRVSEVISRRPEDLLDGWLTIDATPTWRPKSDHSRRILPVPDWCSGLPSRWPQRTALNGAIQKVVPGISSHSLRHAWRSACREAELSTEIAEHLMGHAQSVQLAGVYGQFTADAKLKAMRRVWNVIDGWVL